MLTLFLLQLVASYTCILWGLLFYSLRIHATSRKQLFQKPIPFLFFSGLIAVTAIAQCLVLFIPITPLVTICVQIAGQALQIFKWRRYKLVLRGVITEIRSLHPITKAGLLCTWVLLMLLNTGPTLMDDSDSYHIQAVKWIQQWGTVPGIANLHARYGFNSSWFSGVALFSWPAHYNYYTALNGLISVWFSIYLWHLADRAFKATVPALSRKLGVVAILLICVLLFLWPLLRGNVSSVNYDFITTALIVILFFETFSKAHAGRLNDLLPEYWLWPVFLFTVRLTNFPLLLLSLITLCILAFKKKAITTAYYIGFAVMLVIPFIARNVYLSGYPFFPSLAFNIFPVDWKVDATVARNLLYFIKYFNRVNVMYQPIQQTAALPFPQWITPWYKYLFHYDKPLLFSGAAGFLSLLLIKPRFPFLLRVLIVALLIQLIVWFFIAPDPRFVYGPLLCGTFALFYVIAKTLSARHIKVVSFFFASSLIIFTAGLFVSKLWRDERYRNPFLCYKLPQPVLQPVVRDGVVFYIPENVLNNWNPRCYGSPLPCLYIMDDRLHLRGKTIKEGFTIQQ